MNESETQAQDPRTTTAPKLSATDRLSSPDPIPSGFQAFWPVPRPIYRSGHHFGGMSAGLLRDTLESAKIDLTGEHREGVVCKIGPNTFEIIYRSWDRT